jgi:hypothetical protein
MLVANGAATSVALPTQLRAEVAELEQRAETRYAAQAEATDAPSANRDPEYG